MGNIIDQGPVLVELGVAGEDITDAEQAVITAAIRRAEGSVIAFLRYDPVQRSRTEYYPVADQNENYRQTVWEANDTSAYLRYYSQASSDELQVCHLPIRGNTTVQLWIDYDGRFGQKTGSFGSSTSKTSGEDFWCTFDRNDDNGYGVCMDGIIRSVGLWPLQPGSVKITYTAGYSVTELNGGGLLIDATPIHEAVVNEAVRRAKRALLTAKATTGYKAGPFTSEKLGDYSYTVDSASISRLFSSMTGVTSDTRELLSTFVNWGISL